jgi:hypothetical protein
MVLRSVVRSAAIACALVCSGVICHGDESRTAVSARTLAGFPRTMLWAWHRPEDLRGLDRQEVGVAFLAATWFLGPDGPRIEPRAQPLLVDPGTPLMAVVRIEAATKPLPAYDGRQIRGMAASLAEVVARSGAGGLQIDYDATSSEHAFYRQLLQETRIALGDRPLSMTALLSWCTGDEPLLAAPVDEVVPMAFQLGVPGAASLKARAAADELRSRRCASAIGVSTGEPTPELEGDRRLYIFSPTAWTPAAARRALREVSAWR